MIVLPGTLGKKLVMNLPLVAIKDHNEVGLACLVLRFVGIRKFLHFLINLGVNLYLAGHFHCSPLGHRPRDEHLGVPRAL